MIIKVSQEFHFNGRGLWIGMEREIVPGIEEIAEYVAAHETLVAAFKAISGQTLTDFNSGEKETLKVIDYGKETMRAIIKDCKKADELLNHWDSAVKYGLTEELNKRLGEFA